MKYSGGIWMKFALSKTEPFEREKERLFATNREKINISSQI